MLTKNGESVKECKGAVTQKDKEVAEPVAALYHMQAVLYFIQLELDFSLHFPSCCLLRVCRKFGPKLASHYKPVENEVKFGLSEPYSAN